MLLFAVAIMAFTGNVLALQEETPREKVIMDADMGQLNDDATVLFMLVKSGKVDVLGLNIVAGNTWVEEGNYGRSMGYHESRRRSFDTPENFPAGTQKAKVLFDIDRDAFWDLYVGLMRKK
jgi:inosine-uridine nucleoside N-ribohydrolase